MKSYYPEVFSSFWTKFEDTITNGLVLSVREVRRELKERFDDDVIDCLTINNKSFFPAPSVEELHFVAEIYKIKHFQQNLDKKSRLKGKPFADPFIIAKARCLEATVVSEEQYVRNGARIPNICEHFGIACIKLQGFLEQMKWRF